MTDTNLENDPRFMGDPRFRYPYNRPPTITQQSSPFYLPLQRDHRFESLTFYPINNECWYKLPTGKTCTSKRDCLAFLQRNCDQGSMEFIEYNCIGGVCDFDITST
jgi:hypothetical protein